ncbi:MAG TPA: VCBS repeat-containing protein, partial [Nannocystis sp.]
MPTSSYRLTCPSLALFLALAGCGDSGGTSESADTTAGSSPTSISGDTTGATASTETTGNTPTQAGTMTEAGSGSESLTGTGTDSTQGTGPTTGTSLTGGETTTDTTGGNLCDEAMKCSGKCCGAGELCDNGECVPDCGGPPPCGEAKECCGAGDLCYLGECVTPGPACDEQVCATKPLQNACGDGFVCDPQQKLCLPSKADPTCQYIPPPNIFKPEPLFTWGKRKVIACAADTDCQVAEVCTDKVCTPTWQHWIPGADDMPNHYQCSSIPVVVDIDDNCVPDIIFNTYTGTNAGADGVVRAIRGDTGEKLWTITDPAYRTNSTSNLAVGDIDGDGLPEILADGEGKRILAFKGDGTPLWKSDPYTGADSSGSVAIADMDGEGGPEIIFGAAIFSNAGKKVYEGAVGIGRNGQGPISCIADLDGDGRPELIGGRTAYKTTGTIAANDFKGAVLWTNAATDGFCGVADFDPDGQPEVVLVTQGKVLILNGLTGVTRATANIPAGGTGGPPNIADFDGDSLRDIGVAGSARYTVFQFDAKTNTMSQLWTAATEDDSSQVTGSSVFDFDGDGRNEVVYNDEAYIRIYPGTEPDCALNPPGPGCDKNMTDAEVLFRDRNSSRTRTEYPVIADVNGDFKADIVFSTNNDSNASLVTDAGVEVFKDSLDNWVSTRPVWNQHTYHITNVGLVGEIPVKEDNSWTTPMDNPYNSYRN